ncbi:protoheme IX farnesyltransferase, mitochondrial [Prosopis cineraria]|uniref:protoheme IX farnesyltransferase, mitochondrial n=1 Tax=Prosopis cineraria TaxID=364024 RepID=UPI00240FAA65|nr:protoheme IX farnesyltransferase, mitochondrial [Prosopis cineraria]
MRSSLRFYSKLLQYSSQNLNPPSLCTDGVLRLCILSHSHRLHSSSSVPDSNSLKLGLTKSDGIPAVSASSSSTGAVDLTSLISASPSKAREIVDLTRHYSRCYWELSKARLSMLVVATSGTGFVLGSSTAVDFPALCWTCMGTMMVAASANSLNQVFEINNDAKMKRTSKRPLPSGRISIPHAVNWASFVGLAGTALLATKANMLAAGLAASNLVLYAFVYTPLKQIHPVNTWVGAIVGAIPPLLGWAAAAGDVSLNALILPAALYFWQIPHFMALAYMCRSDYAAGGFKMYSLADPSGQRTASVALRNSIYLIPLGFLAYDWGVTSGWFCLESLVLTAAITASAFSFCRDRTKEKARRMFYASLLYLPVFMSGLLIHRVSNNQLTADSAAKSSSSMETSIQNDENFARKTKERHMKGAPARPPVAYASVAPFPFLPAPLYNSSS